MRKNAANVRGSTASPVGQGVRRHKQFVAPSDPETPPKSKESLPDHTLEAEWVDRPQLKDQIRQEEGMYWKFDHTEVKIFDLAVPDQLAGYNALLTGSTKPDTNMALLRNKSKWCEQTANWKVLVEVQYVLFRKILLTQKDAHEEAS